MLILLRQPQKDKKMQKTIYDPEEEEKKELEKVEIKPQNLLSGLFIGYNPDKSLNCAI